MVSINEKEWMVALREMKRYMRPTDAVMSKSNGLPIDNWTTDEHWWGVARIAREGRRKGFTVLCEPRFREASWARPDVWFPSVNLGIEIWHSEGKRQFLDKMQRYVDRKINIRVGYIKTSELPKEYNDKLGALDLAMSRAKLPAEWLKDGVSEA